MMPVKTIDKSVGRSKFTPILIVQSYLSFTVLVFAFGPWPWDVGNPITLYTYLFLVQVALLLGYLSITANDDASTYAGRYSSSRLFNISVALNLIAIIPFYYIQLGRFDLSPSGMLSQIVAGATDPGRAYKEILSAPRFGPHMIALWIYMLFTPILWLSVPLGVAAWRSLSLKMKAAIAFIVMANVATWIAIGTIQGVADNVAIIALSLLASRRKPLMRDFNLRHVAIAVCMLLIPLFYFLYAQDSRGRGRWLALTDKDAGITLDTDNIMIAGMPTAMQRLVGSGCSYLTQGYYALSLALEEPFQWTYGVGHSLFWTGVVQHVTDFDVTSMTYPARIDADFGWNMEKRWDSVYPWLASDVSFPGTLILMFLIGRLLASIWMDSQSGENPFALPLFAIVMLFILYFPANDKILTNGYSVVAFWGLLGLWLSRRRAIRRGQVRSWKLAKAY